MDDAVLQVRSELRRVESELAKTAIELARLQGRVSAMPTQGQIAALVLVSSGMALALSLILGG
jgi:hypothetical protein